MKNKIITALVLILCLTNIIVVIFLFNMMPPGRRGNGFPPRRGGGNMMDRIDRQLGLTADQSEKMKQNRLSHDQVIDSHFEEMMALRKEFVDEAMNPELDMEKVEEFARMIGDKKAQFELDQLEFFQKIKEILTPEQLENLKGIMSEMPGGPGGGPGRGHGPDEGPHGPPRMDF